MSPRPQSDAPNQTIGDRRCLLIRLSRQAPAEQRHRFLILPLARDTGHHWILIVMDVSTRRIIGFGVEAVAVDGPALGRRFNQAIAGQPPSKRLSYDHDPLFDFDRWQANLRILGIDLVCSVPYAPMSHPFVERLIGSVRQEYLDRTFFWNKSYLEQKLERLKTYSNEFRAHQSLDGNTPAEQGEASKIKAVGLEHFDWQNHGHGLFQLPIAAGLPIRHPQALSKPAPKLTLGQGRSRLL